MAAIDEIRQLRKLTDLDGSEDCSYSEETLGIYIDTEGSITAAAALIWSEKAAKAATLVDVTESGSSRKLGDIMDNALKMRKAFVDDVTYSGPASGGSFTVSIERV